MREEMRAVWVATVSNIDIRVAESEEDFKKQFINILETMKSFNMNALAFQIRPCNDAFYRSELNPWSEFLTGKQGKDPGWDPLAWMVEQCHERNIEFHAWLNPYRVSNKRVGTHYETKEDLIDDLDPKNFARKRTDLVILDGRGAPILNPGEPEVKQFIYETIEEIVTNYPVDAIHFDDYFYPYADIGDQDQKLYEQYRNGEETLADWRRRNIDDVIYAIHKLLKNQPRSIHLGISPFAIWRNKKVDSLGSDTNGGSTYDEHYADTRKWVKEEWIDYIVPQLYWEIGHPRADYEVLANWWADVVRDTGVKLYIGLGFYRYGSDDVWQQSNIIPDQLKLNDTIPEIQGTFSFSFKHFNRTDLSVLNEALNIVKNEYWKEQVRTPK